MGRYLDYYTINLSVDDKIIDFDPDTYSFSLHDSIYNLYSSCIFEIEDVAGFLQEGLALAPGAKYKLEYGNKDIINSSEFVIDNDNLEDVKEPGYLDGRVSLRLKHAWWYDQVIRSKGYQDRISQIVRDIANTYNFTELNINDTGNEDTWIQPLITDAKFITEMLLPNAFSRNANNTPFYCFIDVGNVFNFRNMDSMLNEEQVAEINYTIDKTNLVGNDNIPAPNKTTTSIRRWSKNSSNWWPLTSRRIFKIDRTDGTLSEEEDAITEYPAQNNLYMPILRPQENGFHSYKNVQFSEYSTGRKENVQGWQLNSVKDGMFVDEFLLIIPLNPALKSGKIIQFNVFTVESRGQKLSKRFSGRYLIEDCEHIWNGEERRGFSKIVIGRKYVALPSSYNLRSKLF